MTTGDLFIVLSGEHRGREVVRWHNSAWVCVLSGEILEVGGADLLPVDTALDDGVGEAREKE